MESLQEGPWRLGLNSVDQPGDLPSGQYQWLFNGINKGGNISTRPGQRAIQPSGPSNYPKALKIFSPKDGIPLLVHAERGNIYYFKYPFDNFTDHQVSGLSFGFESNIEMEIAVIGVVEDDNGNITAVDPYPVLMICDGTGRTGYWDGTNARHLDPNPDGPHETPTATWMKWIGNRLWTMQGRKVRVSNLLNPIKFTEENILSEGGYFNLPDIGNGFGVTPDFNSLLAFTEYTTTSFQAGILNRASWPSTQDFQKVIFGNIGCAAGRSIVNQYGMTWWYSHGGLINLNSALQTYRSSEIKYKDHQMRRSSSNLSDDISGICAVAYENYLLISVPSGDMSNYHTWVMDGNPQESLDSPAFWASAWTGIRPVQYCTGVINGKSRCFALSNDLPPSGVGDVVLSQAAIWEMFLQDRRDIGYNNSGIVAVKDVPTTFETRLINLPSISAVKYIEMDIEEIIGTVQLDIYYCARRGVYKKFGSKQISSTIASLNASITIPTTFPSYLPQRRTVRTVNESLLAADLNPQVETPLTRNEDKGFSFLITWTGQMSMSKMRIFFDKQVEQMDGNVESNEATDRYIRPTGDSSIAGTGLTALPVTSQKSGFMTSYTPRWSETVYQSST